MDDSSQQLARIEAQLDAVIRHIRAGFWFLFILVVGWLVPEEVRVAFGLITVVAWAWWWLPDLLKQLPQRSHGTGSAGEQTRATEDGGSAA